MLGGRRPSGVRGRRQYLLRGHHAFGDDVPLAGAAALLCEEERAGSIVDIDDLHPLVAHEERHLPGRSRLDEIAVRHRAVVPRSERGGRAEHHDVQARSRR